MLFALSSFRRFLLRTCLSVCSALAIMLLALSLVLHLAKGHPQWVAQWLSARAGMSIQFDRLTTQWTSRGPLIRLHGLRIARQQAPIVKEAEIIIAIYSGLLPGHALTELRLRGLEMTLQRDEKGRWSILGLPPQHDMNDADPFATIRRLGELQISGGRLRIVGVAGLRTDAHFSQIDLRMRASGHSLQLGVHAWLDPYHAPLKAILALDSQRWSGQLYVAAMPANLVRLSHLFTEGPVRILDGTGDLRLWMTIEKRQLARTILDVHLQNVGLQGNHGSEHTVQSNPAVQWTSFHLLALWQQKAHGWLLALPQLRLADGAQHDCLDGVVVQKGQRVAIAAHHPVNLGLLIKTVASIGRLPAPWQHWLLNAAPTIQFRRLTASGASATDYQVTAKIDALKVSPVGQIPGVDGFSGTFLGDDQGSVLTPASKAIVQLKWPTGFGAPVAMQLAGSIVAWPLQNSWRVQTSRLQVTGDDFGVSARGGFAYDRATAQTRLFLVAVLDDTALPVAKRFWIHSHMPKSAIDWLDMALVGGKVTQTVGLADGNLHDWPFDNVQGRFEVTAHVDDGQIRFAPNWPMAQNLHATVHFLGNGFTVAGRGELGKVAVDGLTADIANFSQSQLHVDATGHSEAHDALALLEHSPLQTAYGDVFHSLTLSGPVRARFGLTLPLASTAVAPRQLQGDVLFDSVDAQDKPLDLMLKHIQGQLHYSDNGFRAVGLNVQFANQPGRLDLRCGEYVSEPQHRFEAQLSAPIHTDVLFARVARIAWLRPYVQGQSTWQVSVNASSENRRQLVFESDLVGTALTFPPPLQKPTVQALPIRVVTAYPFDQAEIQLSLADRLGLRIHSSDNQLGVSAALGTDHVADPPPAKGLHVAGTTPILDPLDWISVIHHIMQPSSSSVPSPSPSPDADASLPLQDVNLSADHVLLFGGEFPATQIHLVPRTDGIAVRLQGPALAGNLAIPTAMGQQMTGQLDRFYWQPIARPSSASDQNQTTVGPSPDQEPLDPAQIPGFQLSVNDVRVGDVRLGPLRVAARQQGDGLKVEQFQITGPVQTMTLTGMWQGKDSVARTDFTTHIASQNLGELARVIGYGNQLQGGQGHVDIQAAWQGSPLHLAVGSLQGRITLDAQNGQLSGIHPGAGRVLSFLSVTQLPRRLMLDFRDLFAKGLAFNTLKGQIDFANGFARTQTLTIDGPAADIVIRGVANLTHETFDQTVDVNPRSGNLLTVVGAVAGGPVGAAVGAAATAVLGKPLSAIGARRYHLTGPWNDPKVDVLSSMPASNQNRRATVPPTQEQEKAPPPLRP